MMKMENSTPDEIMYLLTDRVIEKNDYLTLMSEPENLEKLGWHDGCVDSIAIIVDSDARIFTLVPNRKSDDGKRHGFSRISCSHDSRNIRNLKGAVEEIEDDLGIAKQMYEGIPRALIYKEFNQQFVNTIEASGRSAKLVSNDYF